MFKLSSKPLEKLNLSKTFHLDSAGAFVSFEGRVRNDHQGKKVIALTYEAAPELCQKEAQKILNEVKKKFDVIDIYCFHRVGRLKVGETAIRVGVLSSHRDAGFKACRYIVDEVKKRVPIWKKEHFFDTSSHWVNCHD